MLLEFDGGVTANLTLNQASIPVYKTFEPPVVSGKLKLTVLSIYTQGNNGFRRLAVWASERPT